MVILLVLLASACFDASPQNEPSPRPNTGIFGRVVDAETHQAVRRAAIKVYTSKEEWDEFTDGEGRFKFPDLARSEYTLIAHRDGYTDRAYTVERSDFDEQKSLPVELHQQGVIAGQVVNSFGQALQSAQIQALRNVRGSVEVIDSAETNDLGGYRLAGLDPGTYRLRATYREGRASEFDSTPLTMASSYYGGREKPAEIAVKAGSVTAGIDFILNAVRPVSVRGTLHTEAGILNERATLWIMGQAGEGGHNGDGSNGKFEIAEVGPGTYTISAETLNKTAPLFGIATVNVGGADVEAVDLVLRPIPKIEVEVRVEGGSSADLKPNAIFFTRTDQVTATGMKIGHLDKERKFTIGLIPGEYGFRFGGPIDNFDVPRVTLDGQSITNWKLHIDGSREASKLVIVLGAKRP